MIDKYDPKYKIVGSRNNIEELKVTENEFKGYTDCYHPTKLKIKESQIPVEFIFGEGFDEIKRFEPKFSKNRLKIKPVQLHFYVSKEYGAISRPRVIWDLDNRLVEEQVRPETPSSGGETPTPNTPKFIKHLSGKSPSSKFKNINFVKLLLAKKLKENLKLDYSQIPLEMN